MLPTRWPKSPIEKLCSRVTSGGTPSRSNSAYYDGGTIPWVKTGELRGWYVENIEERITPLAVAETSAKVFPSDTVLLAMYGDGKTMGSVGLLRSNAATNQACCAMLPDVSKCDAKFLMYSLMYYKPALLKLAISGAQRNLNGKTIKAFEIGAPPVEAQRRIASILSAYDNLIENNTRRIAILEEMAWRIYEEWFVRFRFPGHETVRMAKSELGPVPEGWKTRTLGEVCARMNSGNTPSRSKEEYWEGGTVDWYKTKELWDAYLFESEERVTEAAIEARKTRVFETGTILMAIYGSPTVGRLGITTRRSTCNQAALGLLPSTQHITFWMLYYTLLSLRAEFNNKAQGAAQQNISKEKVEKTTFVLPSMPQQIAFTETVGPMQDLIRALQRKTTILRQTRDLLLPKLISGELDVSSLPEPEAAVA